VNVTVAANAAAGVRTAIITIGGQIHTLTQQGAGSLVEFVIGHVSGTIRNNYPGWVGLQLTVGASPVTVEELGRIMVLGNTGTHIVKLIKMADGQDVPGGSVSLSMSGGTAGQFKYAALPSPVTLDPNTAYFLLSEEIFGGDTWYDLDTTVTTTGVAAVTSAAYGSGPGTWTPFGGPNQTYGPVNFKYSQPPEFTITASDGGGGSISPSGSITKTAGSSQTFTATPNANYIVNEWLVDGGVVQSGGTTYTLSNIQSNRTVQVTFRIASDIAITQHPQSADVVENNGIGFNVAATGSPTLTYQWQRLPAQGVWTNLIDGSGAIQVTTPNLYITTPVLGMSGDQFRCVVSNGSGSVNSNAATLTVYRPAISNPSNQTVASGQSATFGVTASGLPPAPFLTPRWYRRPYGGDWAPVFGGPNYSGESSFTLTVLGATMAMNGDEFYFELRSSSPAPLSFVLTSTPAILTVIPASEVTVVATDATAGEPLTGRGSGTFTFSRTGSTASALTVSFSVGGTATAGSDYTPLGTSVTIPAGSATATKPVDVLDDVAFEGNETVVLTVSAGAGYTVGSPSSATITVEDDDNTTPFVTSHVAGTPRNNYGGWVGMQIAVGPNPVSVSELGRIMVLGNTGTHTVKLVKVSDGQDVPGGSVSLSMSGGTAGQFKYAALPGPVILAANTAYLLMSEETGGGDTWYDLNTTVTTTGVAAVTSAAYGSGAGPWVPFGQPSQTYGPVNFRYGSSPLMFTIAASAGNGGSVSPSGNITKAVGSSQTFTATPNANYSVNEWLVDGVVVQSGGTSYILSNIQSNRTVQVTFSSGPAGTLQFLHASTIVLESMGAVVVDVARVNGSAGAVGVQYATVSGTASAPGDYTHTSGTLTWTNGDSAPKSISIPIVNDSTYEVQESFSVSLTNPTGGATIGTPSTISIRLDSDDPPPPAGNLQFLQANTAVLESTGTVVVSITRTDGSAGTVGVQYETVSGSAAAPGDYTYTSGTLNWTNGDTAPKTISIPIVNDSTPEVSESFSISLANPTGGATLGIPSTTTITVDDDDGLTTPYVESYVAGTIRNNYGGWVGMQFTVGPSPVTVKDLGRIMAPGNSATHTVKLIKMSDGQDVPGGSVSLSMSGGTVGQFKYTALPGPVILAANTSYLLMTEEAFGGDTWHDVNTTVTTTGVAVVTSGAYGSGPGAWSPYGGGNQTYGPVNFKYDTGASPPSRIIALTGNLTFGYVLVGGTAQSTMTIANNGTAPLTVSGITYPAGFSGNWTSGTIMANDSQPVTVTFSPTAPTAYGGNITINSDATSGGNTIAVTGTGTDPIRIIALSGDLSYGSVSVGNAVTRTLTIAASGNAPLTVSGITYPTGFSGNWASGTIVSGGSQPVTVTFAPTAATTYGGAITVGSDATGGVNTVMASGSGSTAPVPVATAATDVTASSFRANWGPESDILFYLLDVATDASFTNFVAGYFNRSVNPNTPSESVTGLTGGTTYYYRVRSYRQGISANSNVITVTTTANETPPVPVAAEATNVTSSSFQANWGLVSGITGLLLDVATDAGFTNFVAGYNNRQLAGSAASESVTGLTGGTMYYYRVRSYITTISNSSAYSNVIMVMTTGTTTPFVTSHVTGTQRNNYGGWVGMQITVGASPMTVKELGRIMAPGNSGTHTVKLVNVSDGLDVPGGSVSLAMSGGTVGEIKYVALASPVVLAANTAYLVMTQESFGGDTWYDVNTTIATTGVAVVNTAAYGSGPGAWVAYGGGSQTYGPVSFKY